MIQWWDHQIWNLLKKAHLMIPRSTILGKIPYAPKNDIWSLFINHMIMRGNVWLAKVHAVFSPLLFFSLHDLSCLLTHPRIHSWLRTRDLFLCVRVQTCKCWRLMWNWGLYGTGGYDRRWKHLLQFTLRVIMCPCAVLSIKANMCARGLYDFVVPETPDTLVVRSCGGFWRLSCPCAVLSVKANMCALGLHGSEGYHVFLHLILCYNLVVSPLHYFRTLPMIPKKIPETPDSSGTYRKHSGHSCGTLMCPCAMLSFHSTDSNLTLMILENRRLRLTTNNSGQLRK